MFQPKQIRVLICGPPLVPCTPRGQKVGIPMEDQTVWEWRMKRARTDEPGCVHKKSGMFINDDFIAPPMS
jgi:hypothetical protein